MNKLLLKILGVRSWLGALNFYLLQWTGFRLKYEVDEESGQRIPGSWGFVRMKPMSNWVDR